MRPSENSARTSAIMRVETEEMDRTFAEELDLCESYGDVFELVKRAVEETLGQRRVGLLLYLGNLPLHVGAFHPVGSNIIVVNRRHLQIVTASTKSVTEINSFIFSILLHEYLHSLGYMSERRVRKLVYEIIEWSFGADHPATKMAIRRSMPLSQISKYTNQPGDNESLGLELIRDFERSNQTYIS